MQTVEQAQLTEQTVTRPFHESIVDALRKARGDRELSPLLYLLRMTKIPKNHDAIIAAWDERRREMGWLGSDYDRVTEGLLQQKQEAEKQPEASS